MSPVFSKLIAAAALAAAAPVGALHLRGRRVAPKLSKEEKVALSKKEFENARAAILGDKCVAALDKVNEGVSTNTCRGRAHFIMQNNGVKNSDAKGMEDFLDCLMYVGRYSAKHDPTKVCAPCGAPAPEREAADVGNAADDDELSSSAAAVKHFNAKLQTRRGRVVRKMEKQAKSSFLDISDVVGETRFMGGELQAKAELASGPVHLPAVSRKEEAKFIHTAGAAHKDCTLLVSMTSEEDFIRAQLESMDLPIDRYDLKNDDLRYNVEALNRAAHQGLEKSGWLPRDVMVNWEVSPSPDADEHDGDDDGVIRDDLKPQTLVDLEAFKAEYATIRRGKMDAVGGLDAVAEKEANPAPGDWQMVRRAPAKHMYVVVPRGGAFKGQPQIISSYTDANGVERWGQTGQKVQYEEDGQTAKYMPACVGENMPLWLSSNRANAEEMEAVEAEWRALSEKERESFISEAVRERSEVLRTALAQYADAEEAETQLMSDFAGALRNENDEIVEQYQDLYVKNLAEERGILSTSLINREALTGDELSAAGKARVVRTVFDRVMETLAIMEQMEMEPVTGYESD